MLYEVITRAQLAQLQDEKPFIQGYVLADWLRAKLSLVQGKVQPQHLLKQLCVDIQEVNLEDSIQAIACWREHMQPVILLNIKGTHHKTIAGQNASLAHELCHLLVDRHHALPAIEVLGGRLPKSIEQRANAFAADRITSDNVCYTKLLRVRTRECALRRVRWRSSGTAAVRCFIGRRR